MKRLRFPFALACLLALAASCLAQNADTTESINVQTKTSSTLIDARAAARRALATHDTDQVEPPAATTPTTGKLVFNIKIDVNPGLPTTAKIGCEASVAVADITSLDSFENIGEAAATRSGSSATCTITLPYGWFLASPTKDAVGIGIVVTSTTGTLGTPPFTEAASSQSIKLAVPANGATTTENIVTSI